MKKFLISLAFLTASVFAINSIIGNDTLDNIIESNVEALANTESDSCNNAVYEYDADGGIFATQKNFRRCGDCKWVSGYNPKYGC